MTTAPQPQTSAPSGPVRWLYVALGLAALVTGVVGIFLPLLPTTPLLLVALWAFSKSSRRLHQWLYHHPRLGPGLRRWRNHRVIPVRVKATAWTAMLLSNLYVVLVVQVPWWAAASMAAVCIYGAVFIGRCPSAIPPEDPRP